MIDLRKRATARRYMRPWSRISAIVLHQTACLLGERPSRYLASAPHFFITRMGQVLWLHPLDAWTASSHGLNRGGVAIELDGHFAGVAGDLATYWRPKSSPNRQPLHPTQMQVDSARDLCRWIVGEVAAHGGEVRHICAHRQASADRRSDPGQEVWQRVAMPCMSELGLSDGGPGFTCGDGAPIPEAWDARCVGVRY